MNKEELRQAGEAARVSENFYRAIFEAAADALVVFDPETGNLLAANEKMGEMFGYRQEDVRDLKFWALDGGGPGGLESVRRLGGQAAAGEPQLFEWQVRDSSGLRFWTEVHLNAVDLDGRPWVLAAIREITGRQQVRQALKESEARFRVVTEGSLAGVFILQGDRLVYANPMLSQIFGYAPGEITALSFLQDLVQPPDRPLTAENIRRLLTGELPWVHQSLQGRHRDGSTIYCEVLGRRVEYQGQPAIIGTLLNITARREMEEALRESEKRYRAIVEDQTELVTRFRPDGTITFVNEANCRYFGKTRSDLLGKSFLPFIPEEDQAQVKEQIFSLTRENPLATVEHRVLRPDGQVAWQQWTNRAIFDDKGRLREFQAVGRDITARRRMEEALRETRDHLQTLIQASPLAIVALSRDFHVRIWNPAAEQIFGWTAAEVLGRLLPTIPAESWPERAAPVPRELQGGQQAARELRCLRKDGAPVDVNLWAAPLTGGHGEMVGDMWIFADITARKRGEAALKESEEKYRALMDNASDAIILADPTGAILEANKKTEELLGYTKEELLHFHYSKLYPARELERVNQKFREALEKGGAGPLNNTLVLRKDGKEVPVDITGSVIEYAGKRVAQGILRDTTERKRAQEALRKSEQKLRHLTSQLLTAQERERRRVSRELHDELGQALTAVKIHLVGIDDRLRPEQQALKGECEHLLAHIDEIIENVRRLAWDLSPSMVEDLGLASALGSLLDEICGSHQMECSLRMDEVNHLFSPEVQSNIYRIFQEALTNIARHARASRVSVVISKQEEGVAFAVADDGAGFNVKETFSRRASRKRLGLTTMMERARMAGGTLNIRSHKGRGTRITFTLPLR